jgi:ABC-type cobalamin/Fe3+-siderophores transport system ATPase subunit
MAMLAPTETKTAADGVAECGGLDLRHVSKRFGSMRALDDCSFSVTRGRMLGFLGPNGAGKTTMMRAIFGLVELDSGELLWDGRPVGLTERQKGRPSQARQLQDEATDPGTWRVPETQFAAFHAAILYS